MVDIIDGKVIQNMCLVCDTVCENCGEVILLGQEFCFKCKHVIVDEVMLNEDLE